jgi:hypothetical protein
MRYALLERLFRASRSLGLNENRALSAPARIKTEKDKMRQSAGIIISAQGTTSQFILIPKPLKPRPGPALRSNAETPVDIL